MLIARVLLKRDKRIGCVMARLNIRETKREENKHKGKNQVHTVVPYGRDIHLIHQKRYLNI
jgi:hypothetical protein